MLDDNAAYQLIFEPGFSTAEAVSNLTRVYQRALDDAQRDVFDREFLRWGKGPKGGGPRPR